MRSLRRAVPFLLAVVLCTVVPLGAQPQAPPDSVVARFDRSVLAPPVPGNPDSVIAIYAAQSDFNYEREIERSTSLWDRIAEWIGDLFDIPAGQGTVLGGILEMLPYILIAVAAIFITIQLAGADLTGMLSRRRRGAAVGDAEEVEERLEEIDLEGRIAEAERTEDWQRAVRWRYLLALRDMERRGLVVYRPDRTNREYQQGLPAGDLREAFASVTLLFEFAWYGRVPLDRNGYARVRDAFAVYGTQLAASAPILKGKTDEVLADRWVPSIERQEVVK